MFLFKYNSDSGSVTIPITKHITKAISTPQMFTLVIVAPPIISSSKLPIIIGTLIKKEYFGQPF